MWRSKEAAIHRLVIHSEIARPAPRLTKSTAIRQSLQNAGQGIYQPPLPCYCLDSGHYASEGPIILKHCPTPTRPHNCCCLGKYPAPLSSGAIYSFQAGFNRWYFLLPHLSVNCHSGELIVRALSRLMVRRCCWAAVKLCNSRDILLQVQAP